MVASREAAESGQASGQMWPKDAQQCLKNPKDPNGELQQVDEDCCKTQCREAPQQHSDFFFALETRWTSHCYPCSVGQSPHNRIALELCYNALLINLWSQVELHVAIFTWLQIILHQEWGIWTQSKFNWAAKLFGLQKARGRRDLWVTKTSERRFKVNCHHAGIRARSCELSRMTFIYFDMDK